MLTTSRYRLFLLSISESPSGCKPSLVAESVLLSTVRALPGDGIAGHTPYVFFHTTLTDAKTAATLPAKTKFLPAAVA